MSKKQFKMPHSYVIIFMLLIFVSVLTYIIPAGEYTRITTATGLKMVDSTSYHLVKSRPVGIWLIPNFVMKGLIKQANIIFPLLVIGGALETVLSTGMFHAYCNKLARKCSGKEKIFIPAVLLLFAVIGITQSTNKFIGFAPLGVMLAATLGYDAVVGVAMILLGVGIGFSTGILAPTTAIAQEMAELTAYSGMGLRIVAFVLFYLVTAAYIVWYGERAKKDPTKSVLYGVEGIETFDLKDCNVEIEKKHPLVLGVLIVAFGILMYGCIKFGWGLVQTADMFYVDGICSRSCLAAVALILQEAKVLDTVVYGLANMLEWFPNFLKAPVMLIMNVIVNGFVTSGTGQAAVVMPVMVPLADVSGITRQTAVLAYKMGDGFCNYILPHASALMGFLGATGITYDRWMKFMGKLFLIWMLLGSIILSFAYFTQYV